MGLKIEVTFFQLKTILNKSNVVHDISSSIAKIHNQSVDVVTIFKCFSVVDSIQHILVISAKYL